MAKTHPLLFASVYQHLHKVEAQEAAQQLALLEGAGSSTSATAVGKHLASGVPQLYLNAWVSKGLNGNRALNDLDFYSVPLETIILAWQSGVLSGYDNIKLTQYLTAEGYRPALRWLIWLQGTPLKYLQQRIHKPNIKKYQLLLQQHTNFGHLKGDDLAKFYSKNWNEITWNEQAHKWLVKR
jgi:hypothetical protein